ncbi:MAG: hypothetical protein ABH950_01910 [Candidatus Altiarchaeota archaeon]
MIKPRKTGKISAPNTHPITDTRLMLPEIDSALDAERREVEEMIYLPNSRISPESLIRKSLDGPIGFLDLFAYHNQALNPRAIRYHETNPDAKVVHVGLEFTGGGWEEDGKDYLINYDVLRFLKRVAPGSVGYVNIDFADRGEQQESLMQQAARVLQPNGQLSMYVEKPENAREAMFKKGLEEKLRRLGFSELTYPPIQEGDYPSRRPDVKGQMRVVAVK